MIFPPSQQMIFNEFHRRNSHNELSSRPLNKNCNSNKKNNSVYFEEEKNLIRTSYLVYLINSTVSDPINSTSCFHFH